MLSGLLKPDWQSSSSEERLQAIHKMRVTDHNSQADLLTLVKEDSEATVRFAALAKIGDPRTVFEISRTHPEDDTRVQAETALVNLIGAESGMAEADIRLLIADHPQIRLAVAQHCSYAKLRSEIICNLSEEQQVELIAGVDYNDTRQLIANNLHSEEYLQRARNLLKGKDKSAEKIIKSKLDALHTQQRTNQENQLAAVQICEKMEFLADHDWRSEFKGKYSIWHSRWDALDYQIDADTVQRYTRASKTVSERVIQEDGVQSAQADLQKLAHDAELACAGITTLTFQDIKGQHKMLNTNLKAMAKQWSELIERVSVESDETAKFMNAQKAMQSLLDLIDTFDGDAKRTKKDLQFFIDQLNWPKRYPVLQLRELLAAELLELQTEERQDKKNAAAKLDKLHKRINRLLGTTKQGDLAKAERELGAVTKVAKHYQGKDKKVLDDRLATVAEAVKKMADWKEFVIQPKVTELCDEMERLVNLKTHPDKLATDIVGLQKRWKALGQSQSADQNWPRFKAAADKAYEPCAVFFKQRRKTRKQNLNNREPLVQQMRALLENTDWDKEPDYKQIEREIQGISNAWQKIKDVEPGAGQKQWRRLSKTKTDIYKKLDIVFDANIKLKHHLIEQAVLLSEAEPSDQSLARMQLYQSKWKQIGITRRKQDQLAWKKFKTATDSAYEKIQGKRQAKRADEDAQIQPYRIISREIQKLAKNATDLATADKQFDSLQSEYDDLPELPRGLPEKLVARLKSDYQRASDAYNKSRDRIKKAGNARVMESLDKKAALCTKLECLSNSASKAEVEKIKDAIVDIKIDSKELSRRIEKRFTVALNSDKTEANKDRQRLCIDLEILLGKESPSEDAGLRMQIQLDRMKQGGLGQPQAVNAETINKLKIDWLCLPGADPNVQKKLDQRFAQLINNSK